MALQGTLDSFSLPDVLRLLASTEKSGRLHVEGDRGEGSIWIGSGAIVGANAERALPDAPVDEVVFEMLRFGEGSFVFHADEAPDHPESPTDVDKALDHAAELLEEWRELEAVVPSLDHRVAIAPELTVDQVTVDAARWKTLVALAPGIAVGDLGSALKQGELAVSRTVNDLVELGIAVVEQPEAGSRRSSATPGSSARRRGERSRTKPEAGRRQVPPRRERSADGDRDTGAAAESTARAGWLRDENGNGNGNGNGTSNGKPQGGVGRPGPAFNGTPNGSSVGTETEATGPFPPANGNGNGSGEEREDALPRRSRATGKRTGRRANVNGSAPVSSGTPPQQPAGFTNAAPVAAAATVPAPTSGAGLAGLPAFNNNDGPMAGLDAGPLGPSPLHDSGQTQASSLPPDLNWASDEDETQAGGPALLPPSLATGSGSMGGGARAGTAPPPVPAMNAPQPPQLADGEMAGHVSVLSAEARLAVENTVGAAGGGSGLVSGANPDENMQRGALLGFLASVHHQQ